ncbi:MAG: TolC family protein [Glaciecola sp.]|nr:TolC family protein [Glaciecola sp.]
MHNIMNITMALIVCIAFTLSSDSIAQNDKAQTNKERVLSLQEAIAIAQNNDDWLVKSKLSELRLLDLSRGALALPDPTISIGLLNLPTDGFAFNQEAMTQFKVGISQILPRGNTLTLQEKHYQTTAAEQPFQRADRSLNVALQTSILWLDAYRDSANYELVQDAKPLFDQLNDIVGASYTSFVGNAKQQDIIRAELELVRLEDRLFRLDSDRRVAKTKLSQFLSNQSQAVNAGYDNSNGYAHSRLADVVLPQSLVPVMQQEQRAISWLQQSSVQSKYAMLATHPVVSAIEQRILASTIEIDIAKQALQPQYAVNASYALRDDTSAAMGGNSRADFLSIGVNVSLPLFSSTRQDAHISASTHALAVMRTDKRLLLQELFAGLNSVYEQFIGAEKRAKVYEQKILPQLSQLSQTALNAYTNDTGSFADVVTAKIMELDAQASLINITIEKRKALAHIHYYLAHSIKPTGTAHHE